uniref:Ribosomal protein S2 n=1 Tax=Proschkinia sp. SZCZR1824 TaxID=2588390 RepID=A0A4Y5SFV1_9STRA|nr:ribosomal protein S2 [Proschkinia sp. SZCZR1824]
MKITKKLKFQNKLVKLHLLETKAFDKKSYLKLEDVEYRLKHVCHIIHKYNMANKSVLFVGIPTKIGIEIQKSLNSNQHIFMPISIWIKGMLSNKKFNLLNLSKSRSRSKNKFSKLVSKIKTKIELIVILSDKSAAEILDESYASKKPIILLNKSLGIDDKRFDYLVPGNLRFKNKQFYENLFYSILVSTLKKRRKTKK